ncbi:MAG: Gfo/Idh/MocA family oxidoreductase [Bacteroidia bacterium]|nr:Gfo/Idh/MocA family oxidoreductase [Bacteroidia bacterium]MDW8089104.1 Gfo/Idh/MocA family oxidoreductase [Bacteroidia bacterium]
MSRRVRVGLVGLGHMGRLHLKRLLELPAAEVVALFDTDSAVVQALQAQGLPVVPSYEALLEASEAVIIASPTPTHAAYAEAALRTRRHVLIEKPVTTSLEALERLLTLQDEAGVVALVGHIERFNPAFQALWPLRQQFHHFSFERLAPWTPRGSEVSVVLDLLVHDLDLFWALTEGCIADLRAVAYRTFTEKADTVQVWIDLVDGRGASFSISRNAPYRQRRFLAHGPTLWAEANLLTRTVQLWDITSNPPQSLPLPIPHADALQAELEHFLQVITEGLASPLSLEHVYGVMLWAWKVEALAEQRLVFAP